MSKIRGPKRKKSPFKPGALIGAWLLLRRETFHRNFHWYWWAKCTSCGIEKDVREKHLLNGKSKHCRKCNAGRPENPNRRKPPVFKVGQVVGYWTIIDPLVKKKFKGRRGARFVQTKCVCGQYGYVREFHLVKRMSQSCGCSWVKVREDNRLYGRSSEREHELVRSNPIDSTPSLVDIQRGERHQEVVGVHGEVFSHDLEQRSADNEGSGQDPSSNLAPLNRAA